MLYGNIEALLARPRLRGGDRLLRLRFGPGHIHRRPRFAGLRERAAEALGQSRPGFRIGKRWRASEAPLRGAVL